MSKYIDADVFRQELKLRQIMHHDNMTERHEVGCIIEMLDNAPAADVVEVTRCKECRRWTPDGGYGLDLDGNKRLYGECSINKCTHREDYFCPYGKREEE